MRDPALDPPCSPRPAFVSLFAPTAIGDARRAALKVRERQFRAAFDPRKTIAIARAIVAAKVTAEGHRRFLPMPLSDKVIIANV